MTHTPLRPARSAEPAPESRPSRGPLRRWVLTGSALAVIVLGAGAYALSREGDSPGERQTVAEPGAADASGAAGANAAGAQAAKAGASGTEGSFTLTVTGTRCGVREVGPADLTQRAAGEFCLVDVAVKNSGREPELLDGGAQRAVDGQGRAYSIADQAAVFLNDQDPSLLDEIPPGATVLGVLPFDVPAGTTLDAVMVHATMDSPGVRVSLS